MQVIILEDGRYSDFYTRSGKAAAQRLKAGDEAEFPADYADSIVRSGLAEYPQGNKVLENVVSTTSAPLPPKEEVTPLDIKPPALEPTAPAATLITKYKLKIEDIESRGRGGKITLREVKEHLTMLSEAQQEV